MCTHDSPLYLLLSALKYRRWAEITIKTFILYIVMIAEEFFFCLRTCIGYSWCFVASAATASVFPPYSITCSTRASKIRLHAYFRVLLSSPTQIRYGLLPHEMNRQTVFFVHHSHNTSLIIFPQLRAVRRFIMGTVT